MTVEELKKRVLEATHAELPELKEAAIALNHPIVPTWVHALAGVNLAVPEAALDEVRLFIAGEEKADG